MSEDLVIRGALLVGGPQIPMDLVVRGDRLHSLTPTGSRVPRGRVVQAQGRHLAPGLWDMHVHPTDWAAVRHRVDLTACAEPADVVAVLRRHRADEGPLEIVAAGLWCASWPQPPTRADLDVFDVPVTLVTGDAHSAVFNAAALAHYGLGEAADDQGWVREQPWFAVMPHLGAASQQVRDRWVLQAGRAAAARGVVGIVDLDPGDTHEAWRRRHAAGFEHHRVRAGVWADRLDCAIGAGLRTGDPVPGAGPLVRMGPLKIIADGSLNTGTAFCRHAFPDGGHGAMNVDQAGLVDALRRAAGAGVAATLHAIGDAALTLVLDAFEETGARGSVEHVQLATAGDLARMARMGLTASVQPQHLVADRDLADVLWAGQTDRAYAFADMLSAGVRLVLGSDAPVAPLDPWLAISAAVLRTDDDRPAWHPEQAIGLDVALMASWGGVTRLASRGPADLVLLDADPLRIPVGDLARMPVAMTVCAGKVTHAAM